MICQLVPQLGLDRHGAWSSAEEYGDVLGGPVIPRVRVSDEETQVDLIRPYVEGGHGRNPETAYSYRVQPRCVGGC